MNQFVEMPNCEPCVRNLELYIKLKELFPAVRCYYTDDGKPYRLCYCYPDDSRFTLDEWRVQMKAAIEWLYRLEMADLSISELKIMVDIPMLARYSSGLDFYYTPEDHNALLKKVVYEKVQQKIAKNRRAFLRCVLSEECLREGLPIDYKALVETHQFFQKCPGLRKQIGAIIAFYL